MKTRLCLLLGLAAVCINTCSAANPTPAHFSIGPNDFLLDGKPFLVRCGEMHFARIPRHYWEHRLRMARAMGLNTVCAYLFWNFHEPTPGREAAETPHEHAAADGDTVVRHTLGVQHTALVDHHVVADPDLVGVTQRHTVSEEDVTAARTEQARVEA